MVLFDNNHTITKEEVQQRVKYFKDNVNLAYELINKNDKQSALQIARRLRAELKEEYEFYSLKKNKHLENEEFFPEYFAAITDSYVKTPGQITYKNINSFLYDIDDYMDYWQSHSQYKL